MKIEINITKPRFYAMVGLLVFLGAVIVVGFTSDGYGDEPIIGHSSDEIIVDAEGTKLADKLNELKTEIDNKQITAELSCEYIPVVTGKPCHDTCFDNGMQCVQAIGKGNEISFSCADNTELNAASHQCRCCKVA